MGTVSSLRRLGWSRSKGASRSSHSASRSTNLEWDRWDDPSLAWVRYCGGNETGLDINGTQVRLADPLGMRDDGEKQHGDTFNYVFDASIAISKALEQNRHLVEGRTCLELGAGRGMAGFSAVLLGASFVTVTDLPFALEVLKNGVVLNNFSGKQVEVTALSWFSPGEFFSQHSGKTFDVVLAADCVWLHDLVGPFVDTLCKICDYNPNIEILFMNLDRLGTVGESFMELMEASCFDLVWCLPGGDPAIWCIAHPGTATGGLEWHPDYIPNARMNFRCFRRKQAV